jgi:hypothetical protein
LNIPSRDKLLKLIESGVMSEKDEKELLALLEDEVKHQALKDYEVFAQEYIKITDKKGDQVSFSHNPIQKKINAKVKELKEAGNPVRIIILKARQHGASTNEQGRMLYNTATKENRNGLIVAQDDDTSTTIFNKAKYMYDNLPANVKPLQKASNAKELIFDRPTGYKGKGKGLNSSIRVQVAGKVSIGRGNTIHYAHLSEVAFWQSPEGKEVKKQISGILQAVPKTSDTEVVIESTANGYNDFKELWDEAVAGENEWVPLFFPWHENPDYAMECTDEEYERIVSNLDKKVFEYLFGKTNGSKKTNGIVQLFNLTKEQVKWWVWTYRNDCNSDMNMMKQENPTTPEEAFISTGTPVFDNEKVSLRIAALRQLYKEKPPKRGYFTFEWGNPETHDYIKDSTIKWVDDPNGFIKIYEDRIPGHPYVLGGDTKGEGRDFYTGQVIDNTSGLRVATIRNCWTNSKPYTWQMYCLGMYYNTALIGIEVNFNTAPIEELERLHYPRQYTRRRYDDAAKEWQNKHGWKTDGNTRPLIIDKEIHLIEENIDLFTDIEMLEECLTFVYKENGKADAMSGKHDDALFADMIANEIRQQQSFEAEREPELIRYNFDDDNDLSRYYDEDLNPFN